jgi:alpha-L-fucosidase
VIAIKGPDVRWCGNEAGHTRESEWSVLPLPTHPEDYDWPDKNEDDLGSREKLKDAKYLYWYPAETNTSIRIGWFYRDEQQYVKTVDELLDTWYRSVGGNTVFLLNLTPDRRGLIPEKDASRLCDVGKILAKAFEKNLATGATITATEQDKSFDAENAIDGNLESCWKPTDGSEQAELVLTLKEEREINRIVLQECIKKYGQRIESFAVDIWNNDDWKEILSGTTVGYKNIQRFHKVKTMKVRLRILDSRIAPTISAFELYNAPEMLGNPIVVRNKEGLVNMSCKSPDPEIYYTLDGTEPDINSIQYKSPFMMPKGGFVRAIAFVNDGKEKSETIETRFGVCPAKWTIRSFSAEQGGHEAAKAMDGDPTTYWHSTWGQNAPNHPHFVDIDLGEMLELKGFSYLPRTDGLGGICKSFRFEVSENGGQWQIAVQSDFANIKNNPVNQEIYFGKTVKARFVRFTSLSNINNDEYLSLAELGIITE